MRYVVIGASASGISAIKTLRELNPHDEIILISKDCKIYSRCLLYHFLDDSKMLEELNFAGLDIERGLNIEWEKGVEVIDIDTDKQYITLDNHETIQYDQLLIASGANTNIMPIPGLKEATNVIGFRHLKDVISLKKRLPYIHNIFIMGAGLVGIDVIAGLLKYNKNITLCDMGKHMLPLQLDEYSANTYQKLFSKHNVKQYYQTSVKELILAESGNCYRVILSDGTEIETDYIVNCAGIRANISFLKNTLLQCDRFGLIVDETGKTNISNIYGAGDVTGRKTVWANAVNQGIVAAYSMSGKKRDSKDYLSHRTSMHFFDIPTISLGQVNGYDDTYQEEMTVSENSYRKIILKDNKIVGAILQGDLSQSGMLSKMILSRKRK